MLLGKDKLLDLILNTKNNTELYKVKYMLETKPFCGVQNCYDLERFVFHILPKKDRERVIEHIAKLYKDSTTVKHPHIFTTYNFYNKLDDNTKSYLKNNTEYITILHNYSEIDEILIRNKNRDNLSYISGFNEVEEIDYDNYKISNTTQELLDDEVSTTLADKYFRTIVNYCNIFPEFNPIFIDGVTNANLLLGLRLTSNKKLSERINFLGSLLKINANFSQDTPLYQEINNSKKIYFFTQFKDFIDLFERHVL